MKKSAQQRANLRCCASCEWIYEGHRDCPKCGFASYGARFVHGDRAYRFKRTQQPWINNKVNRFLNELEEQIYNVNKETSIEKNKE
jgi:hypothetical protein